MYKLRVNSELANYVRFALSLIQKDECREATLFDGTTRDRLPHLTLRVDGEVIYDKMTFSIIEKHYSKSSEIHLLITSESNDRNLKYMKGFVAACQKWYYDEWRRSIGPPDTIQIYHWWRARADWVISNCVPKRSIDTLFFGSKTNLLSKMTRFLAQENSINNVPQKRIILIHGQPGTGD